MCMLKIDCVYLLASELNTTRASFVEYLGHKHVRQYVFPRLPTTHADYYGRGCKTKNYSVFESDF